MSKINQYRGVNKISWLIFTTAIIIYAALVLIVNNKIAVGYPLYYRAIEGNFSPIYFEYNFIPVIIIFLGYQIATPYWFTSFREWSLLRSKHNIIFEQIKNSFVITVSFVFVSWLVSYILLLIFNGSNPILPIKTGLIGFSGSFLGTVGLLLVTVVVDFGIILLPLICNLFLKKKWQVFALAILLNFFLPIFLFMLKILPEADMPINLLNIFTTATKPNQLLQPIILIIVTVICEIVIIYGLNKFHERTEY
ncbi:MULTISPECIES: hypothetical protein [unclassified Lactobacillus]|uniref:hypothetical protein n=1 Tax=unclassified Lactobacillus TaxID=2620435 RepID=UPI0023FA3923|nr:MULTISPECIES: hypothetical protein [unclassified Lactobacillus]MDF7669433.1 hypothetical protein [Lactobacillus sp. ESL0703]WEV39157.1 hypothetical protein OZX58_02660 [Lactobacillus sp. ESL0680]